MVSSAICRHRELILSVQSEVYPLTIYSCVTPGLSVLGFPDPLADACQVEGFRTGDVITVKVEEEESFPAALMGVPSRPGPVYTHSAIVSFYKNKLLIKQYLVWPRIAIRPVRPFCLKELV